MLDSYKNSKSLTKRFGVFRFLTMNLTGENSNSASVPRGVGDAVGVSEPNWYIALVNHNTEKATSEKLDRLGYENYVAIQQEIKVWRNGKRARIDRVVIPCMVFIRCTEKERREVVKLPFIFRFMTNKAGHVENSLNKPVAVIPDTQMAKLRFMLGNSDTPVSFTNNFHKGEKVRVVRGPLRTLEGEIISNPDGGKELVINFGLLGNARLLIDPVNVERIE